MVHRQCTTLEPSVALMLFTTESTKQGMEKQHTEHGRAVLSCSIVQRRSVLLCFEVYCNVPSCLVLYCTSKPRALHWPLLETED